jgi:hypothetical protein
MGDDPRRASCAYTLCLADGGTGPAGDGEAVVDDDGLTVGGVRFSWLDVDSLIAGDHRLTLDLWPGGTLTLLHLARRFDAFTAALGLARDRARVAGLLAHAPAPPAVFAGAVLRDGAPHGAAILLYPTHVTVVPDGEDPFEVPLGAMTAAGTVEEPPGVAVTTAEGRVVVGQLARRRDAFFTALSEARAAQAKRWTDYAGQAGFSDGTGVPRSGIADFDGLLARCCAPERLAGARRLLAAVRGGEARLGFVQLLDPAPENLAAPSALPEDCASFLLVPCGALVALEILSGPAAATYVFATGIDDANRDLQRLHFRRAALALTAEQAQITPQNPHRLALRRLAALQRLRATTVARLIHSERWEDGVTAALAAG